MSILERLYSSGGSEVLLHTLAISSGTNRPIYLINDQINHTVRLETYENVLMTACGMSVAIPKRNAQAAHRLAFAIDGVNQEATELLKHTIAMQEQIKVVYRLYTSNDLTQPAQRPLTFFAHSVQIKHTLVEITAGIYDFIEMRWPRELFDINTAPCLKFIG